MIKYILKRLALLIPTLLGVVTIVFFMLALAPGDPARLMLGSAATPESVNELRRELGLDQPLLTQYGHVSITRCAAGFWQIDQNWREGHYRTHGAIPCHD